MLGGYFGDSEWDESKHKRDNAGKFSKIGGQLGSNEGGTYELTDPATGGSQKYYVKFPKNADQARTEILSAQLASLMNILTTAPVAKTIEGKLAVVSEIRELKKLDWTKPSTVLGLDSGQRAQLARMYYHAKLAKNWDVLGIDASNIMMSPEGDLVQMDTGGSFEFRAQGGYKDYGPDPDDTNLFDGSLPSGKVFGALYKADPGSFAFAKAELDQLSPGMIDMVFDNSNIYGSVVLKFNFAQRLTKLKEAKIMNPIAAMPKAVIAPQVQPVTMAPQSGNTGQDKIAAFKALVAQTSPKDNRDGHEVSKLMVDVFKVPPPPVTRAHVNAISKYTGLGYGTLNGDLRQSAGDLSKIDSDSSRETIKYIDELIEKSEPLPLPLTVRRGIADGIVGHLAVGDDFIDHGYSSTSLSPRIAHDWATVIVEIRLPKGHKALAVPSYGKAAKDNSQTHYNVVPHHESEAEMILARGSIFRVKSIKTVKGKKVIRVHAGLISRMVSSTGSS